MWRIAAIISGVALVTWQLLGTGQVMEQRWMVNSKQDAAAVVVVQGVAVGGGKAGAAQSLVREESLEKSEEAILRAAMLAAKDARR